MTPRALLPGLLLLSSILSAQPVQVGPPQPLSDDVLRRAIAAQSLPAIAAGRDGFFAAWTDRRAGDGVNADVYAARIGTDGSLPDAADIPVVPTHTEDTDASVVWNGDRYVVVYSSLYFELGLTAVEYDVDGHVTNARPIVRPRGGTSQSRIAWNGSRYLVTWRQSNGQVTSSEIHAQMLDASLAPDGDEFVISGNGSLPQVASNGDGFLVTFNTNLTAHAVPVSASGQAGSTLDLGIAGADAEVVSDRSAYYVGRVSDLGVAVAKISANGTVIDDKLVLPSTTISEDHAAIAWAGDRLLLAVADYGQGTPGNPKHVLIFNAVDAALNLVDGIQLPERYTASRLLTHLKLAATNGVATLVYATAYSTADVEALQFESGRLGSLMTGGRQLLVARSITPQQPLGARWGGSSWGTIWLENVDDVTQDLLFGRVSPAGIRIDGAGLDLGHYDGATMAANDRYWLVVAYRLGVLSLFRIGFDGRLLDTEPVAVPTSAASSAASIPLAASAPDGSFLVTWAANTLIGQPNYVRTDAWAVVVTRDGRVLPPQQVSPPVAIDTSYSPSGIAWSGTEYHVAVIRSVVTPCTSPRICPSASSVEIIRASSSGTPIGAPAAVFTAENTGGGYQPRIASDGNGSLVAYLAYDRAANRFFAYARRFDASAQAAAPAEALAERVETLDVAFDGRSYVVAQIQGSPDGGPKVLQVVTIGASGSASSAVALPDALPTTLSLGGSPLGRSLLLHSQLRQLTPEAHGGGILRAVARLLGYGRTRAVALRQ